MQRFINDLNDNIIHEKNYSISIWKSSRSRILFNSKGIKDISNSLRELESRERVVTIAKVFMLTGMVQNLIDGSVKVIAEGEEDKLKSFIDAINIF